MERGVDGGTMENTLKEPLLGGIRALDASII